MLKFEKLGVEEFRLKCILDFKVRMKRIPVVCPISGGVDSAVSLLKLIRSPEFEVRTALFMRNWDNREEFNNERSCSVSSFIYD